MKFPIYTLCQATSYFRIITSNDSPQHCKTFQCVYYLSQRKVSYP